MKYFLAVLWIIAWSVALFTGIIYLQIKYTDLMDAMWLGSATTIAIFACFLVTCWAIEEVIR